MRKLNLKGIKLILSVFLSISAISGFAQSTPAAGGYSESMKVSLLHLNVDSSTSLIDGNLTLYNNTFSNGLEDDAIKMVNFGENFGIARYSSNLSIEQRMIINATDTTFFSMWNFSIRNYRLVIANTNLDHPGLFAYLEDSYLNTSTPMNLNGVNTFDFAVNSDANSYRINRFRIVFKNPSLMPLPVKFVSFTANKLPAFVSLTWNVNNESSMNEYQVEKSVDGINFTKISTVEARNVTGDIKYQSSDANYNVGENFYRIRGVELSGQSYLSQIVKINIQNKGKEYTIYPNPVSNRKIHLQFFADQPGNYQFQLISMEGKILPLFNQNGSKGRNLFVIPIQHRVQPGVYNLRITDPLGKSESKQIHIL
jgi:hypothetical protein